MTKAAKPARRKAAKKQGRDTKKSKDVLVKKVKRITPKKSVKPIRPKRMRPLIHPKKLEALLMWKPGVPEQECTYVILHRQREA